MTATVAAAMHEAAKSVATAEFVLRLRSRGVRNLDVLRAIERLPRHVFVPHRYADLATRDVALPIGCGQTMPEPFTLARVIEAMALEPSHRVLEIGTGSGYATAVLARLSREVLSIERFQTLAIEARTRLAGLGIANAEIVWADGWRLPPEAGRFDRIVVEAVVDTVPEAWFAALSSDGILVVARNGAGGQQLVAMRRRADGQFDAAPILPSRLQPLLDGLSRGL